MGAEYVHKYVGQEPSGRLFNEICLDSNSKLEINFSNFLKNYLR